MMRDPFLLQSVFVWIVRWSKKRTVFMLHFSFFLDAWYTMAVSDERIPLCFFMLETIVMYTDGGSRGNPGPSALGVFIETMDVRFGKFLGIGTNNEAEYAAILSGMQRVRELVGEDRVFRIHLECRMDSELAMRQLTGRYRVKNPRMKQWFDAIQKEKASFANVSFHHVPRNQNKEADKMVNETLDRTLSR